MCVKFGSRERKQTIELLHTSEVEEHLESVRRKLECIVMRRSEKREQEQFWKNAQKAALQRASERCDSNAQGGGLTRYKSPPPPTSSPNDEEDSPLAF
jgi:hypothetical protein